MSAPALSADQKKYEEEKAKRERADGASQFQLLHFSDNDRLRRLVDDPWADHDALDKLSIPFESGGRIKFLILGAGIGGILNAARLVQAGFKPEQIVIIEGAGGVGGTWYWNRYPGLHCDVEAYVYMPMLEEMEYMPTQKYASHAEIRAYLNKLLERYGLTDRVLCRTQVNGLQWDENIHAWKVDMTTGRGPEGKDMSTLWVNADIPILASGLFPNPQVPKVPGIAGFEGPMFHTSRWDYSITGGSSEEAFPVMDKLEGKRVGIIGTGATAVQCVPLLAKYAKEVFVFQRTPSQVNSRGQRDTDPKEWREVIASKAGWQRARQENLAEVISQHEETNNLVDDEWSKLPAYFACLGSKKFGTVTPDKIPEHIGLLTGLDFPHAARARDRVSQIVKDPTTAERLKTWYPTWCKRPTFSDMYLQVFNEDHVHLIDTDGKGIDSITPHGVVANGHESFIDILILSTGYRSPSYGGGDPAGKIGIEIKGRNARSMTEKWTTQGASTLHGCSSNEFPGLFWMSPIQAGATANYVHVLDLMSQHIVHIIVAAHERMGGKDKHGVIIEPSKDAEEAWAMRFMGCGSFFAGFGICTPGYLTSEGDMQRKAQAAIQAGDTAELTRMARGLIWSEGIVPFTRVLEAWREEGKLEGFEVSVAA
ncbi:FAD/NAD(P)-binding domain-containing protein [Polyplosphaeria fusca]|uniref:FAD/NAD(P)-binding domain-containing protein n=1 Tax=Polyplosphaeria fusca TaxID=682080 RepID=A0A9P4V576_9PLEO|nr:FAD/NAD(P)-binding domain-containing protein [Polyplosphaeria fusca]